MIIFTHDRSELEAYKNLFFHELPIRYIEEFREVYFNLKGEKLNNSIENELRTRFDIFEKKEVIDILEITRANNIFKIFFNKPYWEFYIKANLTPEEFLNKLRYDIRIMSEDRNKRNLENFHETNDENEYIQAIEERVSKVNKKMTEILCKTYIKRFKEIHNIK